MKISLIQFAPSLFNLEKNHEYLCQQIKTSDSDIIVFPELALSGYFFLDRKESEANSLAIDSTEMNVFRDLASDLNKIIVVGFAEKSKSNIFNSAAMFYPDKSFNSVYRKTHLFYKEHSAFDRGDTGFFVTNYPDFDLNLGTMICYDWRFPEVARSLGILGADLILCPSNLVTPLWSRVMPARAIENKTYLAVANRFGTENREGEELLFNGQSSIYDFHGNVLAEAPKDGETIIAAEIFPEKTRDKSFNAINDINKDRLPLMYSALGV